MKRTECGKGRQSCPSGLGSLVLARAVDTCAVERLGLGVAREQPESDGNHRLERDLAQSGRSRRADVLKMRRASPDDDPEGDHGVEPPRPGARLRDDRQLEGPGCANDRGHRTRLRARALGSCDQPVHDDRVPRGRDHRDARPGD